MDNLLEALLARKSLPTKSELSALLNSLTPRELEEIDQLLMTVKEPWLPNPGPQTSAYYTRAKAVLYGGAAGGGKTDLLCGLAHNEHQSSIIFRRHFTEATPLIKRVEELFVPRWGDWSKKGHAFQFKKGNTLEIGAVKDLGDEQKYQGHADDLKGFDEATAFAYSQFLYLCGWLRSVRANQRTRIVACTNPPVDEEGMWVIKHWAPWLDKNYRGKKAMPGELRYFISDADGTRQEVDTNQPVTFRGKQYRPESHTFIPSSVADNPFLADTDYEDRLNQLPEPFRSKFLFGDFAAGIGADPYQLIPRDWVEAAQARWKERPCPLDLPRHQLGVDVSRGGVDRAVIVPRRGNYVEQLIMHKGAVTADGVRFALMIEQEMTHHQTVAALDTIGVGTSPYDHLRHRKGEANVWSMNGSESAKGQMDKTSTFGFVNCRAWWWWSMRERLDPISGDDIALPPDPEIIEELCVVNFMLRSNGVQIEAKDDIKKKLGRSPDKGDAIVYAFGQPNVAGLGIFGYYQRDYEDRKAARDNATAQSKDVVIKINLDKDGNK